MNAKKKDDDEEGDKGSQEKHDAGVSGKSGVTSKIKGALHKE